MTVPVWPCDLPCGVLRSGWGQRPVSPNIRTEMDDGEYAVTRKLHHTRFLLMVVWEMTALQYEVFKRFWECNLCGGGRWYDAPVFTGAQTEERRVRFSGDPPWEATSPANGWFWISAELEMRAIPVLTHADTIAVKTRLRSEDTPEMLAELATLWQAINGGAA